jgi:hypothetical protein
MVLIRDKTFTVILLATVFTLFFVGTAMAADYNSTATPTAGLNITPTPNATVTPVPTPAARQVFSSPRWDTDHDAVVVTNNGAAITVVAWIDDPSNNLKYEVDAGSTKTVFTPTILVQNGQIVSCGYQAYENNTLIDSRNFTITVAIGPTPTALPPESVTIAGTIVDADNGTPISGATVTFESITYGKTYSAVPTGSDGTFISPRMYPDFYRIIVSATGYRVARSTTNDKVTVDSMIDTIALARQAGAQTPTPTPLTPSPTPSNPVDSWISLLYNPALCAGTISSMIAVIAGSIGIYEWMERKREGRLKKEKEDALKGGEKKDEPFTGGIKKP